MTKNFINQIKKEVKPIKEEAEPTKEKNNFKNFKFIKLEYNEKIPEKGSKFTQTKQMNEINLNRSNIGLLSGVNNLIMLDLDIKKETDDTDKKDGMTEFLTTYLNYNEEPNTMKQTTRSGGTHYIFIENDDRYTEEQKELIRQLQNSRGYRGAGVDIRKGAGYIVFNGSSIDGKFYKIVNDTEPQLIPLNLLKWILEGRELKFKKDDNLILMKNEEDLRTLLNNFKNVNSEEWRIITTATKNLLHNFNNLKESKIKKIWDEWSKNQSGYNEKNNLKIWKTAKTNINFNYVINTFNKKEETKKNKIKLLESFKPLQETTTPEDMKIINMNNKYIFDENYKGEQLTQDIFNSSKTIIIKSTTGTGKTSNISKFTEKYMKDKPRLKFMSLVNLITLANQHTENFKNIDIKHYLNKDEYDRDEDNIVICINSLMKYSFYDEAFFNNYIIYIDEITSFLNTLVDNDTLKGNLNFISSTLFKIIKNAHKVIVSDLTINDGVFKFLENRHHDKIFLNNDYLKYKNINVYNLKDENEFLSKLKENIKNKDYFFFGSDSANIITKYYNTLNTGEEEGKFKLFTREHKTDIGDASKELYETYTFYSPTISTGVDATFNEVQDVFYIMKGRSINPEGMFQQITRTRNIRNVYIYFNDIDSKPAKYEDITQIKEYYKNLGVINDKIINCCYYNNKNFEPEFIENLFFELFSFYQYQKDTFETNKKQHLLTILKNNGFNIVEKGDNKKLDKATAKEMTDKKNELDEETFLNHIEGTKENENLKNIMNFLKIETMEEAVIFKNIILDERNKAEYINLINLYYNDDKINDKIKKQNKNMPNYKAVKTTTTKIKLLSELEKMLKIDRFNFDKIEDDKEIKFNEELIKKINVVYECKQTPTTYNDFKEYYFNKVKNLIGKLDILDTTRTQINKKRVVKYNINLEEFNKFFKLYEKTNPERRNLMTSKIFYESTYKPKGTQPENMDDMADILEKIEQPKDQKKQDEILFNFFYKYGNKPTEKHLKLNYSLNDDTIKRYMQYIKDNIEYLKTL